MPRFGLALAATFLLAAPLCAGEFHLVDGRIVVADLASDIKYDVGGQTRTFPARTVLFVSKTRLEVKEGEETGAYEGALVSDGLAVSKGMTTITLKPGGVDHYQQMRTLTPLADAPSWLGDCGRLLWISEGNLVRRAPDGTGAEQSTTGLTIGSGVAWSPSRRQLAMVLITDEVRDIWLAGADGSEQVRLTNDPASESTLVWSPDGSRIAYMHTEDKQSGIAVVAADGGEPRVLTEGERVMLVGWRSTSGRLVYLDKSNEKLTKLCDMAADGSDRSELYAEGTVSVATCCPADDRIAVIAARAGSDQQRLLVLDEHGQIQEAPALTGIQALSWSPDGSRIAFSKDAGIAIGSADKRAFWLQKRSEVWLMDADGSGQTRITTGTETWSLGPWSPDGKLLMVEGDEGLTDLWTSDGKTFSASVTSGAKHSALYDTGARHLYRIEAAPTFALWQ